MSVTSLIIDAYYFSNIVSRELDQVTGTQLYDGLRLLNKILNMQNPSGARVVYNSEYSIATIPHVQDYVVPGLINAVAVTYLFQNIYYPLRILTTSEYLNSQRVDNVFSLPSSIYIERQRGGSRVKLYPIPDRVYEPVTFTGTFFLQNVTLLTDIDSILDGFYIDFLTYSLAKEICVFNRAPLPPALSNKVAEYEKLVSDIPGTDLTPNKINIFVKRPSTTVINYPPFSNGYNGGGY